MAISVKRISLWRREVEDRPGMLAATLEPLASAGANLQVIMGYHIGEKAAIEVFPVAGNRAMNAARQGGLAESGPPALLVTGNNQPAVGHSMARAIADQGINIHFLVAQVVGERYSAVFGFGSEDDASRAMEIIKKAGGGRRSSAPARGSRGKASRSARGGRRAAKR
jgi:hypothetical protein